MSSRAARPRSHRRLVGVSAVAVGALLSTYTGGIRNFSYARAITPAAACTPGATQVVDDTSLQTAVANSVDDSIICITADITLSTTLVIDDTTLTLEGASSTTVLSGGDTTRILYADLSNGATDDTLTLRNLTLTQGTSLNADDSDGGSVLAKGNTSGDAFIGEDITVTDSYSFEDGGGIAVISMNSIRLTRARFYDNMAVSDSGAFEVNFANSVVIEDSVFKRNTAIESQGGAFELQDVLDARISGSQFQGNAAGRDGGSVRIFNGSDFVSIEDSDFADDSTGSDGGSALLQDINRVDINRVTVTSSRARDGAGMYLSDDTFVSIANSTFTGNVAAYDGGGLYLKDNGAVSVTSSTFTNNSAAADDGGGMYLAGSDAVSLTMSTFTNNSAGEDGGGVYVQNIDDSVLMQSLSFSGDNAGNDGGAIYIDTTSPVTLSTITARGTSAGFDGGFAYLASDDTTATSADFTIEDVNVFNSTAGDDGGAIDAEDFNALTMRRVNVYDSQATDVGGGVLVRDVDSVAIYESIFSGNSAGGPSGGIDITRVHSTLIMSGTTVSGNTAADYAAGMYAGFAADTQVSISNSTFANNSVPNTGSFGGAGIFMEGRSGTNPAVRLNFVTVVGNSAKQGGGIELNGTEDVSIENSIIAGNSATGLGADVLIGASASLDDSYAMFTSASAVSGGTVSGPGSFFATPRLNPLANNGGPTQTMLPQWDSPAFEAGDPNWTAPPTNDQRGTGFLRNAGGRVNMGAIQGRSALPPVFPPGAPLEVTAVPQDQSAVVSWTPPTSSGSFPITTYRVEDSTNTHTCLVVVDPDEPLACVVDGLENGVDYTFRAQALNGAGWGTWSEYSDPVTPQPDPVLLISGTREGRSVQVNGEAAGLAGAALIPRLRFPGEQSYSDGVSRPVVDDAGDFGWQRRTSKRVYVYFFNEDRVIRSNRVIIQSRR